MQKEGVYMLAIQGYSDGKAVQTLEKIHVKKNQKVIVTVLDEFIEEMPKQKKASARGLLSGYASQKLQKKEQTAWERAVKEKYEDCQKEESDIE